MIGRTSVALPFLALCLCGGAGGAQPAPVAGTVIVESVSGTMALPSNALVTVAPNGRQRRTLLGRAPVDYQLPAWSRDGRRVSYGRCDLDDLCRIGIVNVTTGRARLLSWRGSAPSWSPDGRRLAFATGPATEWGRLSTGPLNGGRVRRLARHLVIDAPSWSPDGRHIAFVALRGLDDVAAPWLYVIRPDGRGLRRLVPVADATDDISGTEIGEFKPSWSPDGRSIATVADAGEALLVVDLSGRIRWRLNRPRGLVFAVSWAPDGRRIAFDDDGKIFVVNRDGTNIRALTAGTPYAWLHGWGPTSRALAITRLRTTTSEGPPTRLSLLDAQGKGERKVLDGRFGDTAWGWPSRK